MCFSILVLVTSVPDDVTFAPPFLDGLPLTTRYTLVFGIEVFVLERFAITGFLSLTVRALEKGYASALSISFRNDFIVADCIRHRPFITGQIGKLGIPCNFSFHV